MRLLILILLYHSAHAIEIGRGEYGGFLGKDLTLLRTPKHLQIEEVTGIKPELFQTSSKTVPMFGYTHDQIWAKLELENNDAPTSVFLEFRGPFEKVKGYLVVQQKVTSFSQAGMYLTPSEESFPSGHAYPVLKFTIPSGKSLLYFTEEAVTPHFPVILHNETTLGVTIEQSRAWVSILFGISITFLFFLLITFVQIPRAETFLLIVSVLSFLLINGFVTGMFRSLYSSLGHGLQEAGRPYYLFVYEHWAPAAAIFFLSLSSFSILMFGKDRFFGNKWSRFITVFALLSQALLGVVSLFDVVSAMKFFSFSFIITTVQCCLFSFQSFREGRKDGLPQFIGWSLYGTFSAFQLLYYLGFIENGFISIWGTVIGFFSLISCLIISIVYKVLDLNKTLSLEKEKALRAQEIANFARETAHNILPLVQAAISREGDLAIVTKESRMLFKAAHSSIFALSHRLLSLSKGQEVRGEIKTTWISDVIKRAISFSNLGFQGHSPVEVGGQVHEALFSLADEQELLSIMRNLIKNSVEAIGNRADGAIFVEAREEVQGNVILIKDNGSGIPKEAREKLFLEEVTVGKKSGSGVGLLHAKRNIETWGGHISVSQTGPHGTVIEIHLPRAQPPEWFTDQIIVQGGLEIVLLDDDILIHRSLKSRLKEPIQKKTLKFIGFFKIEEFSKYLSENPSERRLYILDFFISDQNDSDLTGMDVIANLGIGKESICLTSAFDEVAIQQRAIELGCKVMPKSLIGSFRVDVG